MGLRERGREKKERRRGENFFSPLLEKKKREGRGASEGDETESALASEDSLGRRKKNSSCACKLGTHLSFISLSSPSTRLELDVFSAPSAKRGEIVEEIEAKEAEAGRGILNARERERAGGMRRKRKKGGSKPESDASALPLFRPLPPAQSLLEPAWIVDHSRLLLTIRVWSCLVRGSSLEKRSGAGEMKR